MIYLPKEERKEETPHEEVEEVLQEVEVLQEEEEVPEALKVLEDPIKIEEEEDIKHENKIYLFSSLLIFGLI